VIAISEAEPEVSDNDWCIAHASLHRSVDVLISPRENSELARENVTFSVKVINTGNIVDNYDLIVTDNLGWAPMLLENSLENVTPGDNRMVTLSVAIPENAEPCTEDNVTVIAISRTDPGVSDNDWCIAHALLPRAEFSLVTLYKVSLNVNLWVENGSKLVVKFYEYDNITLQAESVIENFTPPHHAENIENVPHPMGEPIEIVTLVLTPDNTEEVISTMASFTVTKGVLFGRYLEIIGEYGRPGSDKPALFGEYLALISQYSRAPIS
jgi:hypothetical protein